MGIEQEVATAAPPPAPRTLGDWEVKSGEGLGGIRWASIQHTGTQCGQDFYEDTDPLAFAFLISLLKKQGETREQLGVQQGLGWEAERAAAEGAKDR